MEIIAISDLHGQLPSSVGSGDVLVVAGDICPDFAEGRSSIGDAAAVEKQVRWLANEFSEWLTEQDKNFTQIITIPGNHDFVRTLSEEQEKLLNNRFYYDSCMLYREPTVVNVEGLLFYVSPFSLKLPVWAYTLTEIQLWEYYKHIPIGVDVIVSHGPAEDYLDKCVSGARVGSRALKKAIQRSRPSAVICGHIHESYGKYTLGHTGTSHKTEIYNVSQRDEYYRYHHRPVSIHVSERTGFIE